MTSLTKFKQAMTQVGKLGPDGAYHGARLTKKLWLEEDIDVRRYMTSVRDWLKTAPEKIHLQDSEQGLDNAVNKAMQGLLDKAGVLAVRRRSPTPDPPGALSHAGGVPRNCLAGEWNEPDVVSSFWC